MEGPLAHRTKRTAFRPKTNVFHRFRLCLWTQGQLTSPLCGIKHENVIGPSQNLTIHLFVLSVKKTARYASVISDSASHDGDSQAAWGYTFLSFSVWSLAPGTVDVALLRNQARKFNWALSKPDHPPFCALRKKDGPLCIRHFR